MADTKPVLFEVLVDTRTGEVNLKRFAGEARKSMADVDKSSKGLIGTLGGIKLGVVGLVAAFAAVPLLGKAFNVVSGALRSFIGLVQEGVAGSVAQENAERRLAAALRARGESIKTLLPSIVDWASKMQYVVGVDDDALISQQALSMQMGLTAVQAQKLTQVTADAAAALGKDFGEVSQMFVRAVAGGHLTALTRLGIKLDETVLKSKDATQILAALGAKFEGVNAAAMQTFEKGMQNVSRAVGDFKEALADLVVRSPAVQQLLVGLQKLIVNLTGAITGDTDVLKPFVQGILDVAIVMAKFGLAAERSWMVLSEFGLTVQKIITVGSFFVPVLDKMAKGIKAIEFLASSDLITSKLKETESTWGRILADLEATRAAVDATSGKLREAAVLPPLPGVDKGRQDFLAAMTGAGLGDPGDRIEQIGKLTDAVAALRTELGKEPNPQMRAALGQVLQETQVALVESKVKAGLLTTEMGELAKVSILGGEAMSKLVADLQKFAATLPEAVDGVKALGLETDRSIKSRAGELSDAIEDIRQRVDDGELSWNDYVRALGQANSEMAELMARAPELAGQLPKLPGIGSTNAAAPLANQPANAPIYEPDQFNVATAGRGVGEEMPWLNDIDVAGQKMQEYTDTIGQVIADMRTYEGQWVEAMMGMASGSSQFAQAFSETYDAIAGMGAAVGSLLGANNKIAQGLRKIQAGMLLVTGVTSIYEGWVRVARSYGADASGWAMIAKGIAAVAQAKQLGASGGGGAAAAGGGGGGSVAGAASSAQREQYGTYAGRAGGNPYQEPGSMYGLHAIRMTQPGTNTITINAIDSKSLQQTLLENPDNRAIVGEAAYMKLTGR